MTFLYLLIIVALFALPSFKNIISPFFALLQPLRENGVGRLSSIVFIFSVVFILLNTIYIQSIGSGNWVDSGLVQVQIQSLPLFSGTKGFHNKSNLKDLRLKMYEFKDYQLLNQIITTFFHDELDINNRYFLLLKVRMGEYGWRTFHHGIVTSSSYFDNYIEFIQSQLAISIEQYNDEKFYEKVCFHYFMIPKNRWNQFPVGKWGCSISQENQIKLLKLMKIIVNTIFYKDLEILYAMIYQN
jgi:hypothetical protein